METNEPISQPQQTNIPPTSGELFPQKPTVGRPITNLLLIGLVILLFGTTGVFVYKYYELKQQIDTQQPTPSAPLAEATVTVPPPTQFPSPTISSTVTLKTYSNEKYLFSFSYPESWQMNEIQGPDGPGLSFSNITDGHTISITVWRVTGFGYCYKYSERKEIIVGGKNAETADGVGGSEMCDKPEEYTNRGNTFVLIPIYDSSTGLPGNQIHISYDYPLDDKSLAKSSLDQILSTFKFRN